MIAVSQDQRFRRGAAHHVEGIEHLGKGDEVEVGSAQSARRHAGAGEEGGFEAGGGREFGAQPVPHRRHDDKIGFGQQGAQAFRGSHGVSFGTNVLAAGYAVSSLRPND